MPRIPRRLAVADPGRGEASAGGRFVAWCSALAAAGVDGLQLRDRELADRLRLERALAARAVQAAPFCLLLNRRLDLALAAGADGLHLPANGLALAGLRRLAGDSFLIGRSTHAVDEVARARDEGADYAIFGPIFSTPSKPGRLAPLGLGALASAVATGLPVIAIGGIDDERAAAVAAAGAHGIAAIRLFAEPARDADRLRALAELWPEAA